MDPSDPDKKEVRRPMNAFLIFCKRHRSMVREKNPNLDNRNVTRILGDLWANLKEEEKTQYTDLAKQYKDAFMKANPDYKWHNPEKGMHPAGLLPRSPTKGIGQENFDFSRADQSITPGKLADPSNMGGLSLLFMAGQQNPSKPTNAIPAMQPAREKMTNMETGRTLSQQSQNVSGSDPEHSPEKEDRNTVVACGKMVMDSIIDQLYYSKSENSLAEPRSGQFTMLTDKQRERSLLHDLSVSRDELEKKLLINQQMCLGSGLDAPKSSWVDPRKSAMLNDSDMIKNEMSSWSGYKRKRCYSEGFKDTPEMSTLQPFVNPYFKKGDSSSDVMDDDGENDLQPVRKSKRRNRGQRYQELINEGIIQPSKDRQTVTKSPEEAAKEEQMTLQRDSELREEEQINFNPREHLRFDVLSVYPRQIRKRTQSESEKVRLEDSSRYKTGDFDLEAHIATLPACSLEKVAKPKKTAPKPRTTSESRTSSISSDSNSTPEIKLIIPPHLKVKAEDLPSEPVVGSRKRKARKHSITHLMPVTTDQKRYEVDNTINTKGDSSKTEPVDETKQSKLEEGANFTGIKKQNDNIDSENNNNTSDTREAKLKNGKENVNNHENNKEGADDIKPKDTVTDKQTDRQGTDPFPSPSVDQENSSPGDDSVQMNNEEQNNHLEKGCDDVHFGVGDQVPLGGVEDASQNEVVNLEMNCDSSVAGSTDREFSPEKSVDSDKYSEFDKKEMEEHSLDDDISSSCRKEDTALLSDGQVKDELADDEVTDKDPCHLQMNIKKENQGISKGNLGQPCESQVAEVISFHMDDTRGERSQVTIQNSPLPTAVVNS
ncbi:uncharacterized protein LOC133196793 [Saccostrea echinata]|uniref:uncharacterized protein LOC133196793 n=1 Tax=Saccostrea echinata TaxID=191078 RepID=UPI002A7EF834|nr:uncharacterized protein LOC133196793 [Saccostrea echinata]